MLNVAFLNCFAECRYSDCRYGDCHYGDCYYGECRYADSHYGDYRYADCHYVDRRYAGILKSVLNWVGFFLMCKYLTQEKRSSLLPKSVRYKMHLSGASF